MIFKLRCLFLFTMLISAAPSWAEDQDSHHRRMGEEQQKIQHLLDEYGSALNSLDPSAVSALYAKDSQLDAPGLPTATGKESIQSTYEGIFKAISLRLQFTPADITVIDHGYAFATSTSSGPVTVLATKQTTENKYRELWIFKKEKDRWKIYRYFFNQP